METQTTTQKTKCPRCGETSNVEKLKVNNASYCEAYCKNLACDYKFTSWDYGVTWE